MDELDALLRDVRCEPGDPVEVIDVPVKGRRCSVAVIVTGPFGEIAAPRAHPVDQLRSDKLLFEKQAKDMGLKELPQDGDVDIRRGKEPAVTSECAGRGEDVQVRIPGDGKWYVKRSSDDAVAVTPWGLGSSGDMPIK